MKTVCWSAKKENKKLFAFHSLWIAVQLKQIISDEIKVKNSWNTGFLKMLSNQNIVDMLLWDIPLYVV